MTHLIGDLRCPGRSVNLWMNVSSLLAACSVERRCLSLCREFGISRKTGYKFFNRYKIDGVTRLEDQARRPYRHANRLPCQVEKTILSETSASNGNFPARARLRSEIKSSTSSPPSNPLLSALCTLSLTATAWSNDVDAAVMRPKVPNSERHTAPMHYGALTPKVNSCSGASSMATHSPSLMTGPAIFWPARDLNQLRKLGLSLSLKGFLRNSECPPPSALITASRLPVPMP